MVVPERSHDAHCQILHRIMIREDANDAHLSLNQWANPVDLGEKPARSDLLNSASSQLSRIYMTRESQFWSMCSCELGLSDELFHC